MRSNLHRAYLAEARWRRMLELLLDDPDSQDLEQRSWDLWVEACEDCGICQQPGCYRTCGSKAYCEVHRAV